MNQLKSGGIDFITAKIINNDKRALNLYVLIFLLIMAKNFIPEYSILIKCKPINLILEAKSNLLFLVKN